MIAAPGKVAIVTPYTLPVIGGLSSYVAGLASQLRSLGFDVRIFPRTRNQRSPGNTLAFWIRTWVSLRKWNPDLVLVQAHWQCLVPVVVAQERGRWRTFFTVHTPPIDLDGLGWRILRVLSHRCTGAWAVSPEGSEAARGLQTGNLGVIPPGATPKDVTEEEVSHFRKDQRLESAYPVISFVGLLTYPERTAGLLLLVSALRTVNHRFPSAVLLVAGDGKGLSHAKGHADSLGISGSIRFLGAMSRPEIVIAASDIFVFLSKREGLPIAILEAMHRGKPILASRTGGIPTAIQTDETGILVDFEERTVSDLIIRLSEDSRLRERLGESARNLARREFTWEAAASRVLAAIEAAG